MDQDLHERIEHLERLMEQSIKGTRELLDEFRAFRYEQREANVRLEANLESMNARVGGLEGRMGAMEGRMGALEKVVLKAN